MKYPWGNFFFIKIWLTFVLIFFCGYFLLVTSAGATLVFKCFSLYTDHAFRFSSIEGALAHKLILNNASYYAHGWSISANRLAITWRPLTLLRKTIFIDDLDGNDIKISLVKTTSHKKPNGLAENNNFSLPVYIKLKQSSFKNITVFYPNTTAIDIEQLTSDIDLGQNILASLKIKMASADLSAIDLNINGMLTQYNWTLTLLGEKTNWDLVGYGNKQGLTFKSEKTKLLNADFYMAGLLNWTPDILWDITLNTHSLTLPYIADDIQNIGLNLKTVGSLHKFGIHTTQLSADVFGKKLSGDITLQAKIDPNLDKTTKNNLDITDLLKGTIFDIKTHLALDKMRLYINGNLSNNWNVTYQFNSGELNQLFDQAKGYVNVLGTITGLKYEPMLSSELFINSLNVDALPNINIQSQFNLSVLAVLDPDKPQHFSINADLKYIGITHTIHGQRTTIPITGMFNMMLDQKGLASTVSLFANDSKDNFIKTNLNMPDYRFWRAPQKDDRIDGELKIAFNQLNIIQLLFPEFFNPKGIVNGKLNVKGLLSDPIFSGQIRLEDLTFYVPDLAIRPILNLTAMARNNTLNYSGIMASGEGKLNLMGKTFFVDKISTNATIKGENFLISNLPKTKLKISPDLQLDNQQNSWQIKGRVLVPEAYLDFGDTRTTVTLPSHTIIILPNGEIQKNIPLQILTHLDVTAGDNVKLAVNGLKGKLGGKLLIEQDLEKIMVGNGQIMLNGSYDLVGEELSIKDGMISFNNSPLENPALNVRAEKHITLNNTFASFGNQQPLTVGVLMQGTVDNPHVSLFSDPAGWSQSDILSLMLFGQPVSAVSGGDVQVLFKAAQMLSPNKGSNFTNLRQQLQQKLGLSDLRIESGLTSPTSSTTTPETSTSVVLGKYLSPRLYLSYSVGVFNALNIFRLKYFLGKHWFAQTQTNVDGSGLDLFYFLEK